MPSISIEKRKEVITYLEDFPCEVLSIPGMVDLVEGKAQIMALKRCLLMISSEGNLFLLTQNY